MIIVYFDCIGGASGDMLLGALADVGVSQDLLRGIIDTLRLPDCKLHFERVMKGSILATQATVTTPTRENHRHVEDLVSILENAALPESVRSQAIPILIALAKVEAEIHNEKVENVHLHELGGDDTLIDIVGVLMGLAELKVDSIIVSPLPMGRGFTDSAHGLLPLPAPATLALLTGVPIRYIDVEAELVTPTGAALLTSMADRFGGFPPMTLEKVGYGAGHRDLHFPNLVRLMLGDTKLDWDWNTENLMVIETNIDDLNPQLYDHVMERLFEAGALDVTLTPMQMKKNRPAILLCALSVPEKADEITRIFLEETTTIGVRRQLVERICLSRQFETVDTPYGPIRAKVVRLPSGAYRRVPEYEDCLQAAKSHGVPLLEIINRVYQSPTYTLKNKSDRQGE
jgi:uncharacterized protein (TIGR00299 family) protein